MSLLEQHFDVAFAAPDGIKKLRELILTRAMQGKLVPQDTEDETASNLLKHIASEKARLVSSGGLRKPREFDVNDVLIALSCRERGISLITRDRDFRRLIKFVPGLLISEPFPGRGA